METLHPILDSLSQNSAESGVQESMFCPSCPLNSKSHTESIFCRVLIHIKFYRNSTTIN